MVVVAIMSIVIMAVVIVAVVPIPMTMAVVMIVHVIVIIVATGRNESDINGGQTQRRQSKQRLQHNRLLKANDFSVRADTTLRGWLVSFLCSVCPQITLDLIRRFGCHPCYCASDCPGGWRPA